MNNLNQTKLTVKTFIYSLQYLYRVYWKKNKTCRDGAHPYSSLLHIIRLSGIQKTSLVILVLSFYINTSLTAQKIEVGYEVGIYYLCSKLISPSTTPSINSFKTGGSVYFYPKISFLSIKTGLAYGKIGSSEFDSWQKIQLSMGTNFLFGKKKYFFTGMGYNINYIIESKNSDNSFANYSHGFYNDIGFLLPVYKKLSVDVKIRSEFDFSKTYVKTGFSPYAGEMEGDYFYKGLFLLLSIRYKLGSNLPINCTEK